ncbi:MAG: hypothetical protein KJZ78_07665 [Bryobacteraceae bacterium]|nr:hypothetical protein [Bryobacteraceae bacterium]
MGVSAAPKIVTEAVTGLRQFQCRLDDGSTLHLPAFLGKFIKRADVVRVLSPGKDDLLIERSNSRSRPQCLLYTTIGYVAQPKLSENGAGFLARVELPEHSSGPKAMFLSGDAIRRYFYALDDSKAPQDLYALLGVSAAATPANLRMAWRVRQLESSVRATEPAERVWAERAFNILSHPDLRNCYDTLRRDEDATPIFPYGGFGSILVQGSLSKDGEAFFANRILAYKPEMRPRKVSLLLRQCEFFADRLICREPRRKLEVWLDLGLLPGIHWDLTWNNWKHWLRSRIAADATFVRAGKYRLRNGEWVLRTWFVALPSRLQVTVPEGIPADMERARAIHTLLGQHAEVVGKIRAEVEKQPVEHAEIQEWFDRLSTSPHLKPQHVTWRPDYEPYYFEQLRKRSATWFLFREEYLFTWANVLIAEIPALGHATYVFKKPEDVRAFMRRYSQVTREDLRRNRDNVATDLGFVGRVVRGRKKKRWLNDVLKLAGEKADYVEVFE